MDRVSKIPYHGRTARNTVGSDDLPLALNIILRRIRAVGGHSETAKQRRAGFTLPASSFAAAIVAGATPEEATLKFVFD